MSAIYAVYTSPTHTPIPNHLPTLIVTPHGQPTNILYSYLHTNYNTENYLLTPSPQGDLCVAKLFPPRRDNNSKTSASDPGHGSSSSKVVRCEASRNLKWSITNTGVISPIYKLSLPSPDSADLPLFQISKPNPNAVFWSMFYFAYAGHNIPPKRIEFGKIQKNPPGPNGGGTRISITGKSPEEKAVWQTLGEGNEDCVEWVVLCAALNLLDDEIIKAADKSSGSPAPAVPQANTGRATPTAGVPPAGPGGRPSAPPANVSSSSGSGGRPTPVSLRDPGPAPPQRANSGPPPPGGPQPPRGGPPPGARGPPMPGPPGGMPPGPGGRPMQPPGGPGNMPGPHGPGGPIPPRGYGPGGPPPGAGPQGPGGFAPPPQGGHGHPPPGGFPPPGPGGFPPGPHGRPPPPGGVPHPGYPGPHPPPPHGHLQARGPPPNGYPGGPPPVQGQPRRF